MRYRKLPQYRYEVEYKGHRIRGSSLERTLDTLLTALYPDAEDTKARRLLLRRDEGVSAAVTAPTVFHLLDIRPTRLHNNRTPQHRLAIKLRKKKKRIRDRNIGVRLSWCKRTIHVKSMGEVYDHLKRFLYPASQPTDRMFAVHLAALGGLNYDPSMSQDDLIAAMVKNGSLTIETRSKTNA